VKHEEVANFLADFRALTLQDRATFVESVRDLNHAYERFRREGGTGVPRAWPKKLRIKDVKSAPGIWELTWQWPDGRATFEFNDVRGELGIRWRRIGTHRIFEKPSVNAR
jgi:hypothetical protein